jgi:transposase
MPVRFTLTAGQKGDAPQAAALIEGLPAEVVMADTAYDADHLRQAIAAKGALAVIPNNPSRALKYPLDKHLYAQRHLVECCFSKLKQFRRVATRFEKTARNYSAVIHSCCHRLMDEISVHNHLERLSRGRPAFQPASPGLCRLRRKSHRCVQSNRQRASPR